jgi:hypothetical protein
VRPEQPPPDLYAPRYFPLRVAALLVIFIGLLLGVSRCAYAVQLTGNQCQEMAVWASDTIWAKHVGAEKEKVRAYYAEQRSPIFRLILKDLDKIWELDIRFREPLFQAVLQVCNNNRGIYPDEA